MKRAVPRRLAAKGRSVRAVSLPCIAGLTLLVCLPGQPLMGQGGIVSDGPLVLEGLPTAGLMDALVCFDPATGELGQCDASALPGPPPAKIAWVAQSGGDYTSPVTALTDVGTWCGTPSATNPCLLRIAPGVFDVGSGQVEMQPYVDMQGSGQHNTTIKGSRCLGSPWFGVSMVLGASNAELRDMTIENACTSGSSYTAALYNASSDSPRLTRVTIKASGPGLITTIHNNASSSPTLTNVNVVASGSGTSEGMYSYNGCDPVVIHSTIAAVGTGANYGVFTKTSSDATIEHSTVIGSSNTIVNDSAGATADIFASRLIGGPTLGQLGGTAPSCAGVTDENNTFYASACPP